MCQSNQLMSNRLQSRINACTALNNLQLSSYERSLEPYNNRSFKRLNSIRELGAKFNPGIDCSMGDIALMRLVRGMAWEGHLIKR